MTAIYNEIDEYAAGWLGNLVEAGHIAQGRVITKSIRDLKPEDLDGSKQFHAFAGIGVWSHALRLAGWPDGIPVFSGSCPCQPFSAAGAGRGFADERHLWPAWFELIRELRPGVVLGEQVASKAGLAWLDAVFSDLEGAGYSCRAADLCAAGIGAPHIRQRLYFVAVSDNDGREVLRQARLHADRASGDDVVGCSANGGVANAFGHRLEREFETGAANRATDGNGVALGALADSCGDRVGQHGRELRVDESQHEERRPDGVHAPVAGGATRGFWAAAEWLPFRDGKWRPVEPGTFPLAHGSPARVVSGGAVEVQPRTGMLKGYGNAIVAPLAAEFIRAAMEAVQ